MSVPRAVLACSLTVAFAHAVPYTNVPFQIVQPTSNHSSMVVTESLSRLAQHDAPIALISVVGPYHSGKSFLLNALLGDLKAFSVGPKTSPETMGIWLCRTNLKSADGAEVWLMDSEGFFGPRVDEAYDAKVFTIATLLGAHVVYNTVKVIDQQAVSLLEMLARRAQLFRTRSQVEANSATGSGIPEFLNVHNFPPLTWVVEDFVQQVPTEHKTSGATGWLKTYLSKINGSHEGNSSEDASHDVSEDSEYYLTSLYKELNVHTLFLPATKRAQLQDLSVLSWGELTEEFRGEVQELKSIILRSLNARHFAGRPMTGRTFAKAIHFVVRSLQSGRFPDLPSIWDSWAMQVARMSVVDAEAFFRSQLGFVNVNSTEEPTSLASFNAKAEDARKRAVDFYQEMIKDFDVMPQTAELVRLMDVHFEHAVAAWHGAVRRWIADLTMKFKKHVDSKLAEQKLPVNPEELKKLGQATSKNATDTFSQILDNFNRPGHLPSLGPAAALPVFDVDPRDSLASDLQAIIGTKNSENDQHINKVFKVAVSSLEAAAQKELKAAQGQLCSKARVKDVKEISSKKGWQAFNERLSQYPWVAFVSQFKAQKALAQQDLDEAMRKFIHSNDQKLSVHFRTVYERVLGVYKTKQVRLIEKMPVDEGELQIDHDVLVREAQASLEQQGKHSAVGLDLTDTDPFADSKKRLGKALSEAYQIVSSRNVELWKVHSDDATRCAVQKNRALEQRSGTFSLFNKVPWMHRYRSRQHLRECFLRSDASKEISASMQAKIFESWYTKDMAQEAGRVGNYFMFLGLTAFVLFVGGWWLFSPRQPQMRYTYAPQSMSFGGFPGAVPSATMPRASMWGQQQY
jgi:hypothetical protein